MGTCEEFWPLLSARLDGELTEEEEKRLTAHLEECPACRALARELEETHEAFTRLEDLTPPEDFAQGVMARIREGETGGRAEPKVVPLFRRPQTRALVGLAACAVLCLGVYQAGLLDRLPGDRANYQVVSTTDTAGQGETRAAGEEIAPASLLPEQEQTPSGLEEPSAARSQSEGQTEKSAVSQEDVSSAQSAQPPVSYAENTPNSDAQITRGEPTSGETKESQKPPQTDTGTDSSPEIASGEPENEPAVQESQAQDQEPAAGQAGDGRSDNSQAEERPAANGGTPILGGSPEEGSPEQEATVGTVQSVPYQVGGETVDAILTLTALPQGGESVLGEEVQWQTGEGYRWCIITGAQMESLMSLAGEQGQDLTGAATNRINDEQRCALILTEGT